MGKESEMKNLIIIIGTIILGIVIVNTMVLGDGDSLKTAAQSIVNQGVQTVDTMKVGEDQ